MLYHDAPLNLPELTPRSCCRLAGHLIAPKRAPSIAVCSPALRRRSCTRQIISCALQTKQMATMHFARPTGFPGPTSRGSTVGAHTVQSLLLLKSFFLSLWHSLAKPSGLADLQHLTAMKLPQALCPKLSFYYRSHALARAAAHACNCNRLSRHRRRLLRLPGTPQ